METKKIKGQLKEISTTGNKTKLIVDVQGKEVSIGTFDEEILPELMKMRSKYVEIEYSEGTSAKFPGTIFKNLISGGIKVIDAPVVDPSVKQYIERTNYSTKSDADYRNFAVAYAKDLVVSGKIEINQMFSAANQIFNYVKGNKIEELNESITEEQIM
jgi:hypothetical protein